MGTVFDINWSRPDRRSFLAGLGAAGLGTVGLGAVGLGATGLLTACTESPPTVSASLVPLFSADRVITAGKRQRLAFGVVTTDNGSRTAEATGGTWTTEQGLLVAVRGPNGVIDEQHVPGRIVSHDHPPNADPAHQHANLLRYFAFHTTLPEPGVYDLDVTVDDAILTLPVQAFDPGAVQVVGVGDRFPAIQTPTLTSSEGVDPICTLPDGPCPFHRRTAAEIVAAGRPMALLVATPAYCTTQYCGPVLTTVIDAAPEFPDVGFVHVEPWANPTAGSGVGDPAVRTAPSVDALRLAFEPALYLVSSDGIVADRIDNVFDDVELVAALKTLS